MRRRRWFASFLLSARQARPDLDDRQSVSGHRSVEMPRVTYRDAVCCSAVAEFNMTREQLVGKYVRAPLSR